MPLKDFNETFQSELQDPEFAHIYLEEALDDDVPGTFLIALRDVVKANGGMSAIAESIHVNRESLYTALSGQGNPGYKTITAILNSLGLRLSLQRQETDIAA